jgi:hypothetical protein
MAWPASSLSLAMAESFILAVDPGIRGCGLAIFQQVGTSEHVLHRAAYVASHASKGNQTGEAIMMAKNAAEWLWSSEIARLTQIAVEWPRVYATRLRKGEMDGVDPNDLIALSAVDAALATRLAKPVYSYYPSDWKGQMTKEACRHRIRDRLSTDEYIVLLAADKEAGKGKAHNVYDAVGIGLHHTGRLAPRRVIPS